MCLHFSLEDLQHLYTVVIRKDNISICASVDKISTFIFKNTEGNRLHNCTCSAKRVSFCFDDFQQTDEGFFSLHSSILDGPSLKNTTLKQASKICSFVSKIFFI